jgi:hypothetical protein
MALVFLYNITVGAEEYLFSSSLWCVRICTLIAIYIYYGTRYRYKTIFLHPNLYMLDAFVLKECLLFIWESSGSETYKIEVSCIFYTNRSHLYSRKKLISDFCSSERWGFNVLKMLLTFMWWWRHEAFELARMFGTFFVVVKIIEWHWPLWHL